ncbi:MAG: hypothetical protein R3E12_04530 [Candidatus Eisenbacteria bacterium]
MKATDATNGLATMQVGPPAAVGAVTGGQGGSTVGGAPHRAVLHQSPGRRSR